MTKQELQDFVMNLRKQSENGKSRFDPALASIFFKSQSEVSKDIEVVVAEFLKRRGRQPNPEEIAAAYVVLEEKRKKIEDREVEAYLAEHEEEIEIDEEFRTDNEQNQDLNNQIMQDKEEKEELFLIDKIGEHSRLQVREEIEERNLQDRQKALMERTLKILAALEKLKEAMKQEKGMLEIGGDIFSGMNTREIKQQLGLLKAMGVQEIGKDEDGNIFENEGREISIETLTEKDFEELESGDKSFAISWDTLRSLDWSKQSEKMKEWLKERGVELDENESITIDGLEEKEVKVAELEDDEMSL